MSKHSALSLIIAVAAFGFTVPLAAQSRSAVSGAELDAAVAARPAGNRDVVQQFLATDQARAAADGMGVSTTELSSRVATLDPETMDRLRAQLNERVLVGGADTIIISSTVVIIALLIIILLTR